MSAVNIKVEDLRRDFDAIVLCGGSDPAARSARARPRSHGHLFRRWIICRMQNKLNLGDTVSENRFIAPKASTSSSSAAATPAPTASAPPCARDARASSNSSFCPDRPKRSRHRQDGTSALAPLADDFPHQLAPTKKPPVLRRHDIRDFAINTKYFSGEETATSKSSTACAWNGQGRRRPIGMKEIPGSEFELDCDLCLLALGFVAPGARRPSRTARPQSSMHAATCVSTRTT